MVADEDAVVPTVIVPFEFDELRASGHGAGEAERHLHDFGAGVGITDQTGTGHDALDALGKLITEIVLSAEGQAAQGLRLDGGGDFRMGMAEDQRSPPQAVVELALPSTSMIRGLTPRSKYKG
jgi:hypothetical protein